MNGISNQRNIAFGATPKQLQKFLNSPRAKELGVSVKTIEGRGSAMAILQFDFNGRKNQVNSASAKNPQKAFFLLAEKLGKIRYVLRNAKKSKRLEQTVLAAMMRFGKID